MAYRNDATADRLLRTTSLFGLSNWTWMGWVVPVANGSSGRYHTVFSINRNTSSNFDEVVLHYNGTNLRMMAAVDNGSYTETRGTTNLTVGTYYHMALVRGTTTLTAYLNGVSEAVVTATPAGGSWTRAEIGNIAPFEASDWGDIRVAHVKMYDAALTAAQIVAEMRTIRPMRTENLNGWYPIFTGANRPLDFSGNGRTWTEGGTLTDEAPPPISWGASNVIFPYVATAGGTTYPLTVSGTLTSSGGVSKQGNKVLGGTLSPAGTLQKQSSKLMTGALTPAGTLLKQAGKVVSGTLSPAGTLLKQSQKILSGTLTPAGTLSNQAQKVLSGTLTPAGTLSKQVNKLLSGTLSPAGTLATIKTALLNLAGTLTASGGLSKQVNKVLSGTLTSTGLLSKQVNKFLGGTFTPSAVLSASKSAFLYLLDVAGTLTSSGALSKQVNKLLSGTLTPAGWLSKQVNKVLSGILTPGGSISLSKIATKSLGGTLTVSGTVTKQVNKLLSGTMAASGGLIKQVRTFFGGVLNTIGSFIGVNPSAVVVQIGYDVADDRRLPVYFMQVARPIYYDGAEMPVLTDTRQHATIFEGRNAPPFYD